MGTLERIIERVRQSREARVRSLIEQRAAGAAGAGLVVGSLSEGAHVVDLVTGEKGVVIGRTRENIIVQTPDR